MNENELQLILTAIFRRQRAGRAVDITEKFSVKFDEILRREGVFEGVNGAVNDTINEPDRERKEDGRGVESINDGVS